MDKCYKHIDAGRQGQMRLFLSVRPTYKQSMGKKGLLVGSESFPSFSVKGNEAYYVDKTGLIKELIEAHLLESSP